MYILTRTFIYGQYMTQVQRLSELWLLLIQNFLYQKMVIQPKLKKELILPDFLFIA